MRSIYLILLFSVLCTWCFGQARLVKDINTTQDGIHPIGYGNNIFVAAGDLAYFKVHTPKASRWWVTDATTAGTYEITTDHTGTDEFIRNAGPLNGSFIYQAIEGGHSTLKKYTLGGAGIQVLKEFETMSLIDVLRSADKFMFSIEMNSTTEFWISDGTGAGTVKFRTLAGSHSISYAANGGDSYTYFVTRDEQFSHTLWKTDGTDMGTIPLKVGAPFFADNYNDLFVDGNTLYFGLERFNAFPNNNEFWKSDGTAGGTVKVATIQGQMTRSTMQKLGSKIVFGTIGGVWASDGTEAGTGYIYPGGLSWGTIYKGFYYGIVNDYNLNDYFLVKTDGTSGGTAAVAPVGVWQYNNAPLPHVGDNLLFGMKTSAAGQELGVSDGTTAGTILLKDINPGVSNSNARSFIQVGAKVVFIADDGALGSEVWVTDGTTGGTTLLLEARPGTNDASKAYLAQSVMLPVGDKLLFLADDDAPDQFYPNDLWITDGTEANTEIVRPGDEFDAIHWLGDLDGDSYFLQFIQHIKIFKISGTTLEPTVVKDFAAVASGGGGFGTINNPTMLNGKLLFNWSLYGDPEINFGTEYWVTDGTEIGTHVLKDINPGAGDGLYLQTPIVVSNKNYFSASDGTNGAELWMTDGTEGGTQQLIDINPGPGSSAPRTFFMLGDKMHFFADDGTHGGELWTSDGTAEGTTKVTDIFPVNTGFFFATPLGASCIFVTRDYDNGWRLWTTDGTANGTQPLKVLNPLDPFLYQPADFVATDDKGYFTANDGISGKEVWTTDGTVDGTKVLDLKPGSNGMNPSLLRNIGGIIYFKTFGELWRTGGTLETTEKILDMEPLGIKAVGDQIYFFADSEEYGIELFVTPITKLNQTIALETVNDKLEGGANFSLTASATSGLPVTFTATPSGKVTISGNTVTMVKPGKVTITAKQPGNEQFAAAEDKSTIFCITPKKPLVTLKEDKGSSKILQSSAAEGNQWHLNDTAINGATATTFEAAASGGYSVISTVDGCKSETSIAAVITVTGIEEELNGAIFPNPASEKLIVRWNNPDETVGISVFDTNGRIRVNTSFTNSIELPVADYTGGIYLVKLSAGEKIVTRKFMKH